MNHANLQIQWLITKPFKYVAIKRVANHPSLVFEIFCLMTQADPSWDVKCHVFSTFRILSLQRLNLTIHKPYYNRYIRLPSRICQSPSLLFPSTRQTVKGKDNNEDRNIILSNRTNASAHVSCILTNKSWQPSNSFTSGKYNHIGLIAMTNGLVLLSLPIQSVPSATSVNKCTDKI